MLVAVALCLASAFWVILRLRWVQISVGLPLAYVLSLLLIHVPGAVAHALAGDAELFRYEVTLSGIWITAAGCIAFAAGVHLAAIRIRGSGPLTLDWRFGLFTAVTGWLFILGFSFLRDIPTISAFAAKASALWIIGAAIGLRASFAAGQWRAFAGWSAVTAAFPTFTLLQTGFLSSATVATLIVISPLALLFRRTPSTIAFVAGTSVVTLAAFVNYYINRDAIRAVVWARADLSERWARLEEAISGFQLLDFANPVHFTAFDERLNQNYFVGLAAQRLEARDIDFLHGSSIWEAFLALIPRAVWPDKPVFAGSGDLVRDATGLGSTLSETTSWGVGNVMELYINFGFLGVGVGFLALGYALTVLDRRIVRQVRQGDHVGLIPTFLVAVALIFPEGSAVDIVGGAGAALVIGLLLGALWRGMSAAHPMTGPRAR